MRHASTITKQVHRTRATAVLDADPCCRWLANKREILDELGRIDSDYAMLVIAKRICQLKPSTAEAVGMIRRHREFDRLADEVVAVVNQYCKRNPSTTRSEILRALETAGMLAGRALEPAEPGRYQFLRKQTV